MNLEKMWVFGPHVHLSVEMTFTYHYSLTLLHLALAEIPWPCHHSEGIFLTARDESTQSNTCFSILSPIRKYKKKGENNSSDFLSCGSLVDSNPKLKAGSSIFLKVNFLLGLIGSILTK